MAHQIWEESFIECPRCHNKKVRMSTYHFGHTFMAECASCSFGKITGDNSAMALSRLRGNYLEANNSLNLTNAS